MTTLMSPLGDVAEFINGVAFKERDWGDEGRPIIRIQNLNDPTKPFNRTMRQVNEKNVAKKGDLLVSWAASLGVYEWDGEEACINQHIFKVIPDKTRADAAYLRRSLEASVEQMKRQAHGAVMLHITRDRFLGIPIPVPPLPEQRRIAAILDKADALRAKRRDAIAKLDQLLQSVFLEMFGDRECGNNPDVPLSEAFWFQEGPGVRKWQFTPSGVKLLNVGNIEKDGSINLAKTDRHVSLEEAQGKYKHFLVDEGDLVIASSGISFDVDGLLRTRGGFVEKEHLPLCMNTSTIRFKAVEGKSSLRYLQAWINSSGFRSKITRLVTGSAQQNFGPSHLRQLTIPLPPLVDQNRFCRIAARIERQKRALQEHAVHVDTLFTTLQHRAFTGTL